MRKTGVIVSKQGSLLQVRIGPSMRQVTLASGLKVEDVAVGDVVFVETYRDRYYAYARAAPSNVNPRGA